MPVQIQLTLKDYLRAHRAHAGLGYYSLRVLGVFLVLAGILHSWIGVRVEYAILMIAMGVFCIFLMPLVLRQKFSCNKKFTVPFNMTPTSEGVEMAAEYGNSMTRWSAFVHFVESEELFLLYPQPALFLMFPKRCFSPEQLVEFSRLVYDNVPPKKWEPRRIIRTIVVWLVILTSIIVLYQVLTSSSH